MPIKLGTQSINAIKLGTNAVSKVCVGSQQIWGGSPQPVQYLPFYVQNNENTDTTVDFYIANGGDGTLYLYYSSTPLYSDGTHSISDFDGEIVFGDPDATGAGQLEIPANGRMYLYIDSQWGFSERQLSDGNAYTSILFNDDVSIGGSPMSLLWGDLYTGYEDEFDSGTEYNFQYLFADNAYIIDTTDLILPAKTMTPYCYEGMFAGTRVNAMNVSATSWNASYATDWLDSASATGTFTKPTNTTIPTGANGIPIRWTVVNK